MRLAFLVVALAAANAWAADLVVSDCSRLTCPPGVNCDVFIRPACQRCVADSGKSFVIRCDDASCASFGAMTCEAGRAAAAPAGDAVPKECAEAKINVDWVLFRDGGAMRTYSEARRRGDSPIDAVLRAQAHNRHAQDTIRICAGWVSSYLATKGMGSGGMSPAPVAQPARGPSSCSVNPSNDCSTCSITCPEGNAICSEGSGGYFMGRLTCNIESDCRCVR